VERVVLALTNYFEKLSEIISQNPAAVLQTFFISRAVVALSTYAESDLTNEFTRLRMKQSGNHPRNQAPRWRRCSEFLDSGVGWIAADQAPLMGPTGLTWILARFFVEKHYLPEAKSLATRILDTLKDAFLVRLETTEWLSPQVKISSAEKVRAMTNKIGLPTDPDAIDPIAIKNYYADANLTSSQVTNALTLAKANIAKRWGSLGKPGEALRTRPV
jgi:endothelin-converting enzyme